MISVCIIKNRIFPSNTYVVYNPGAPECLLIDPGLDKDVIEHEIQNLGLTPSYIFSTHGHFDHVGSAYYFQHKYKAPFYLHAKDSKIIKSINFFLKIMKIELHVDVPLPDKLLEGDEAELEFGKFSIKFFNYPGHTDGSCLLLVENNLFTGDIVYSKGLGYNPFPGQNKEKLRNSLKALLNAFTEETMIYPGHGSAATLRAIKQNNIELNRFLQEVGI